MPTENRSSNTEMVSVPRVLTREMLNGVCMHPDLARSLWSALLKNAPQPAPQPNTEPSSYPPCDYCGITTDDHPWHGSGMINGLENRHIHACDACRGRLPSPLSLPHPEPIAWMVGTAFWWTKEEAERDAAETGKAMVPFGPMTSSYAAPAEQLQSEPVALPSRLSVRMPEGRNLPKGYAEAWNACLNEIEKLGPVYTRTDLGEERLRARTTT